jgi:hypothetical protein
MEGGSMVSQRLIDLVERSGEELTNRLVKDLLAREETRHLRELRHNRLYAQVYDVYNMLNSWLNSAMTKGKIVEHYVEMGREKYNEGIPLSEVIMTLMLIKRHLWLFAIEKKVFEPERNVENVLELNNRVVFFFDRIIWCVSVGYEGEQKEDTYRA